MVGIDVSSLAQGVSVVKVPPPDLVIDLETLSEGLLSELKRLYPDQPHKSEIWRWQFSDRFGRECLMLTARHGPSLIGFNALMPVSMTYRNRRLDAWWSCDFVVDPAYRGAGVGGRLKERLLERIDEPVLSLGISSRAWPILLGKGWQPGPSLHLYERVFRPCTWRQWLLKLLSDVRALSSSFLKLMSKEGLSLKLVYELPGRRIVDALSQRSICSGDARIVKDYDYLRWRYELFPFGLYRYALVRDAVDSIKGLLIYRLDSGERADIADYIGDSLGEPEVQVITRVFRDQGAKGIVWRLQDHAMARALRQNGFLKKPYASGFVFRPGTLGEAPIGWSLSSGDSDGDFLAAAQDRLKGTPGKNRAEDGYHIEPVTWDVMQSSRHAWEQLVSESDANPLFMNWLWQSSWWSVWGQALDLQLRCYYIYRGSRLVGILPLFRVRRGRLKPLSDQFLGNAWRLAPSVRSEYIEPILARGEAPALRDFVRRWLDSGPVWSSLVVPDHMGYMTHWPKTLVRQRDVGYRIVTQGELGDYLNRLGKNTRLRAFNRQDYLHRTYPDAQWKCVELGEKKVKAFFSQLNEFHRARWGRPCFSREAIAFHCQIILNRSKGLKPLLHTLEVDGQIRSVSYNLKVSGIMYNLQSGFDADFDRKLSLGTLHFGKLIGLCFEDPETLALDMLAGRGKRTDYKNHFQGELVRFYTVQFFPSSILFTAYRFMEKVKSLLRKRT